MTIREADSRIVDHMEVHHIGAPPHIHIAEALKMAISALLEQERQDAVLLDLAKITMQDGGCWQ